ncbi:ABC transporter ATP-binding protein [Sulfitobacter sp. M13]
MSLLDAYHVFVHNVSAAFGYDYNETTPDWVHPFLHLILVIAPALLTGVAAYLLINGLLRFWRRTKLAEPRLEPIRGLDPGLFSSVLRYSKNQQALMIVLSLIAMPILYMTLELPKQIVNNALDSDRFPLDFFGFEFDQVAFLMILCGLYLLAIILNGLNKYALNVFKGYVAERFLRRFRLLVYRQWRNDPKARNQSEIVPILAQEVEPVGGFAADVLTQPILQGGTLATILLFMFVQDPVLGAAALTVLPIQLVLLPNLQRRVNLLSRTRIQEVRQLGRQLSDQLRDGPDGLSRHMPTSASFRALEQVRRRIFRLKFFIKALNNFLTALTPFLFYSLGGYFVIEGRISLGALVAVLAAHKDFSAPLKELFSYYQTLEDTRIRYQEITTFFTKPLQRSGREPVDSRPPEKVSKAERAKARKTGFEFADTFGQHGIMKDGI